MHAIMGADVHERHARKCSLVLNATPTEPDPSPVQLKLPRTKSLDLMAEVSEKLLKCGICRQEFNGEERTPRILPCYHSFCQDCVTALKKEGRFNCPACRRLLCPNREFPVDSTRMALVESKRHLLDRKHQGERSAEDCREGRPSCSRDLDFRNGTSSACPLVSDACVGPRKQLVEVGVEVGGNAEGFEGPGWDICERHEGERIRMYCRSCKQPVCAICALTLHKEGHDIIDLVEKKQEMQGLCGVLEEAGRTYVMRVQQVEASLEALDASLSEAEQQLQDHFAQLFTDVLLKQTELVDTLRAQARRDRGLLEEQRAYFQSLQESARVTGEHIRSGLGSRLSQQILSPDLANTVSELVRNTSTSVLQPPTYSVDKETIRELQHLKEQVRTKFGDNAGTKDSPPKVSLKYPSGVFSVSPGSQEGPPVFQNIHRHSMQGSTDTSLTSGPGTLDVPVSLPKFFLDAAGCGQGCSLWEDSCVLKNLSATRNPSRQTAQIFRFKGTCGTEPVSASTCYWQIICRVKPAPLLREECAFCEVGVATQGAMQACEGGVITPNHLPALTVKLWVKNNGLVAFLRYKGSRLAERILAPATCNSILVRTLGFLLDVAAQRVHVIDVHAGGVLCSQDVDFSRPLWPLVSVVNHASFIKADVSLTLQTGDKIAMNKALSTVLQSALVKQ